MKTKLLIPLLVALASLAFTAARADMLDADHISIKGNFILKTSTNGATAYAPITIPNIVYLLGLSGTPSQMRYYYDATTTAYVIALKTAETSGSGTPIASIYTFGNTYESWNPTNHSYIGADNDAGMNGNVNGTSLVTGVYPKKTETDTYKFTFFGTLSGDNAIMNGTLTDIYPLK